MSIASTATATATVAATPVDGWAVEIVETPSLGDRTYVVHDGTSAAVVDPQRDVDRVLDVVERLGLDVVAVAETHIHNDYVTGGPELCRRTGATYHVHADDEIAAAKVDVRDGDVIEVGSLRLRALATPGHTPTSLSYAVVTAAGPVAVCTGGGLLYGSVGRPDLISEEMTEEHARAQHRSARYLLEQLPGDTRVLPTHGFGSFCSSGDVSGATSSTLAQEAAINDALTIADEDAFVAHLVAGLDAFPRYYAYMDPANRGVIADVDLSPVEEVDATELKRRVHAGEWVVDLRDRRAYAGRHLVGTVNVELNDQSSTYLGWLMPIDEPLTLIGDSVDQVVAFQRQLVRIGVDRPAGRADTAEALGGDTSSYEVIGADELASHWRAGEVETLLDTRRVMEWQDGHVVGAVHVPLHELIARMHEVPTGRVHIHCGAGFRASIAASLLARAGRTPVLVDDEVEWIRAAGLPWTIDG